MVFIRSYPDLLAAIIGFGLLVLAAVTSVRIARRRLRYETWWVVHLYVYLGLALAFAHQIVTGVPFIGHPLTRAIWIAIWASTAGMVIVFRVAQPIWRSLRHQLRVVEVREEAPGVVSVICQGRRLDRLAVSGGQFFLWRFLVRDLWWQAHPYSLSALPQPPYIHNFLTRRNINDPNNLSSPHGPGSARPAAGWAASGRLLLEQPLVLVELRLHGPPPTALLASRPWPNCARSRPPRSSSPLRPRSTAGES